MCGGGGLVVARVCVWSATRKHHVQASEHTFQYTDQTDEENNRTYKKRRECEGKKRGTYKKTKEMMVPKTKDETRQERATSKNITEQQRKTHIKIPIDVERGGDVILFAVCFRCACIASVTQKRRRRETLIELDTSLTHTRWTEKKKRERERVARKMTDNDDLLQRDIAEADDADTRGSVWRQGRTKRG